MTRRQRGIFAGAAAVAALSRLVALSKTPWDWDEVLFCLAVRHYDVATHYPHPPGFPLYVFLGKLARFVAGSDFHALQSVNLIAGMLVFPAIFWLARSFRFDFNGALAAGLLFVFLPNVWYYGGTAFSDAPAMLLFMAAVAAYMSSGLSSRRYAVAGVLLAGGVLIRPQNALVAVFPWTLATIRFFRAKRWLTLAGGSLLIVGIVAVGYGIAAYETGFQAYVDSVRNHSQFVKTADTIHSAGRPPLWRVLLMQLDPFEAGKTALVINLLALLALWRGARDRVLEIVLTFGPFFFFAMFTVNPAGTSRFSLNYYAAAVLLAVEGATVLGAVVAARFGPRFAVATPAVVIGLIIVRFVTWTLPALELVRTTASPPVAAAQWVDDRVPTSAPLFVDESIWPWAHYYAPRHHQIRHGSTYYLVTTPQAADGWFIGNYPTAARDAIVFSRSLNRIGNLVVKRSFESFVQPASAVAHFGAGWHGIEGDARNWWRWSERMAFVMFGPTRGDAELWLRFNVPLSDLPKPVHVTFTFNGARLATMPIAQAENEVSFVVKPRANAPNLLRIDVSQSFRPSDRGSHDSRQLALQLRDWSWRKL